MRKAAFSITQTLPPAFALAFVLATAGGCAEQLLSDNRIRDNTAIALHQPAGSVVITERRYDGLTNTTYVARTAQGSYNCTINGGGALAMGMTNAPDCSPVGSPNNRRRFGATP